MFWKYVVGGLYIDIVSIAPDHLSRTARPLDLDFVEFKNLRTIARPFTHGCMFLFFFVLSFANYLFEFNTYFVCVYF